MIRARGCSGLVRIMLLQGRARSFKPELCPSTRPVGGFDARILNLAVWNLEEFGSPNTDLRSSGWKQAALSCSGVRTCTARIMVSASSCQPTPAYARSGLPGA